MPVTVRIREGMIRQRIPSMQKEKGVSSYWISEVLVLTPENNNNWLRTGAGDKVSLAVARKALVFVQVKVLYCL